MKTLDKFILKSYIGPMILTFFIVSFIFLMNFLWLYIDDLVGKGLDFGVILELLGYASATTIPMSLPLATLLAAIMTMGNLGENNELLAMKSAGISLPRILAPLTVLVVFIAIGSFFASNNLVPYAWKQMNALIADIRQQKQTIEFKDGAFFNGIDDMSIRVGHQDRETGLLNDVLIYDTRNQSKNGTMSTTIADSGYIRLSDDKKYLLVTLYKGERYEMRRDYQWYNESQFTQQTFDMQNAVIPLEGFDFERSSSDRFSHGTQTQSIARLEKDIDSLNIVVAREMARSYEPLLRNNLLQYDPVVMGMMDSVKTDYSYRRPEPVYERLDYMTLVQRKDILNNALMKAKNSRNAINYEEDSYKQNLNNLYRSEIEWHRKVSLPVSVMIFFLIGAPLGAIIRKGGLGMPVVVSVLFFVVYYIISMSGEKMARDGISTAFQGMWLSSFILLPIALYLIYKSTNDSNLFNMDWYRIQYAKLKEWVGRKRQHRKESKKHGTKEA